MFELSLAFVFAAFVAGVLMFFAPCTFPLVPAFLAFISGIDTEKDKDKSKTVVRNAVSFCLGFSFVFIGFGMLAGYFGELIGSTQGWLSKFGGLVIIVFGLMMLDVIKLNKFLSAKSFSIPKVFTPGNTKSSALIGASFAFGWTPCVGPILASILFLVSTQGSFLTGGLLLAIFSLGLSIPFILTAIFYDRVKDKFAHWASMTNLIMKLGGVLMIIFGLLLFFESYGILVEIGTKVFIFLNLDFIFNYY
jgi:cytochrome c-type biogenesis protein